MYDTINLYHDARSLPGIDFIDVAQYLDDATEKSNKKGYSVTGKLRNLHVRITQMNLSITGSHA